MKKKKFKLSPREVGLFAVLCLILLGFCYYKFFYVNIQDQIKELNANRDAEISQTNTLSKRIALVESMRKSLEENRDGMLKNPIPKYDNGKAVTKELEKVLSVTDSYSLNFSSITHNDYIAQRPVRISFSADSYSTARAIVTRLDSSESFNQISDVSINMEQGSFDEDGNYSAPCTVSMNITYFEVDG